MPVTERQLRNTPWTPEFLYEERISLGVLDSNFRVFTNALAPGLALIHDGGKIYYRVKGVGNTDSFSQAVKWWNRNEQGRRSPPGSIETIGKRKGSLR